MTSGSKWDGGDGEEGGDEDVEQEEELGGTIIIIIITKKLRVANQGFIQDFWLGGEIYWCINEARKCERRGLGASPSLGPPPPPPPLDKLNAYAHRGCI